MKNPTNNQIEPSLAFLSVITAEGFGACGGLLVVTPNGRPVEFHCTAPVTTNRTQEILYGNALQSFVYCDQIGQTILEQAKTQIDLVVVDHHAFVELAGTTESPLVIVSSTETISAHSPGASRRAPHQESIELDSGQKAVVFARTKTSLENAKECLAFFRQTLDVSEPFERIRNAIDETLAVAR